MVSSVSMASEGTEQQKSMVVSELERILYLVSRDIALHRSPVIELKERKKRAGLRKAVECARNDVHQSVTVIKLIHYDSRLFGKFCVHYDGTDLTMHQASHWL